MPISSSRRAVLIGLLLASPALAKKGVPVEDFTPPFPVEVPVPATPGAIFSAGYSALTSGARASQVGDILTVVLVERMQATKSNSAKTGRNGSLGLTPPTTGPSHCSAAAMSAWAEHRRSREKAKPNNPMR